VSYKRNVPWWQEKMYMSALNIKMKEYGFVYNWIKKQVVGIIMSMVAGAIILPTMNIESEEIRNNLGFWVLVGAFSGFLSKLTTEIALGNSKYFMKGQFSPTRWLVIMAVTFLIMMFTGWTLIMVNIYHLPIYLMLVGSYAVMHSVFLSELRRLHFLPTNEWLQEMLRWSFFGMQVAMIIFPLSKRVFPARCGNGLAASVFWAIPYGIGLGIIVGFCVAICVCLIKFLFYKLIQQRNF
jgi:hypothetical protein